MKDLANLLLEGDYTLFMILALMLIFVWLFKDIKKSLLETKKHDLDFLDQSINSYAQVLKTIYLFLNNSIDENDLLNSMYSSYQYFDDSIIKKIDHFTSSKFILTQENKFSLLIDLSEDIKNKLKLLKNNQLHSTIKKNHDFSTFEFFDMVNRNHLDIYGNAFLYSMLILCISLNLLRFALESFMLSTLNLIILTASIVSFILWFFSISISIDLLIHKHYKNPLLFILFVLMPFILAYFFKIYPYFMVKLLFVFIFICSIIISFFMNVKYAKNKK